jgi:hypothetical protein
MEVLDVVVPPNTTPIAVTYKPETTVANLISQVKDRLQSDIPNCGIFFPRYGMWLDEANLLFNYNFTEQNKVEFRARVDQIVVRIYICDYDLTIAIKVMPTQTTTGYLT